MIKFMEDFMNREALKALKKKEGKGNLRERKERIKKKEKKRGKKRKRK